MWVIQSPARLQHDHIVMGRFYVTLTQNEKIVELYVLNILMNNFLRILLDSIDGSGSGIIISTRLGQ